MIISFLLFRHIQMQGPYKVITLCGSTRFKDQFIEAQKRLTLEGNIVISVGLFGTPAMTRCGAKEQRRCWTTCISARSKWRTKSSSSTSGATLGVAPGAKSNSPRGQGKRFGTWKNRAETGRQCKVIMIQVGLILELETLCWG